MTHSIRMTGFARPAALAAALLVGFALPSAVVAEDFSPTEMGQGVDMLQLQLNNMIKQFELDVNVDDLTLAQLTEISQKIKDGATTKTEIERAIEVALAK